MLWLTLRQLKSANPETRKRAVERLSESKDRRALDALVAILEDENPGVHKSAELALSRLGEPAVGALESALRLAGPEARVAAASALARIRGAADSVVVLLGDSDPGVRKAASEALSELKWKAPTAAARAQFLVARCDWAQLPALGFAAVAPLLAVIEEQGLRRPATQALCDLRPGHDLGEDIPTAVQQLLGALNHKDGSVRQAAATVLGRAGDRKAAASLAAALCDSDGAVSRAALDALKVLDPRWPKTTMLLVFDQGRTPADQGGRRTGVGMCGHHLSAGYELCAERCRVSTSALAPCWVAVLTRERQDEEAGFNGDRWV